jgi:hypothetical protein
MITYENALNYYHAAELAANDSKNWTEEERKVLSEIARISEWRKKLYSLEPYSDEADEHFTKEPKIAEKDFSTGKHFVAHIPFIKSVTFYIHVATTGFNVGIINEKLIGNTLTASEAAALWGLDPSTVKKACQQGKFSDHEARKSGGTWLVTVEGMERVYGPKPAEG